MFRGHEVNVSSKPPDSVQLYKVRKLLSNLSNLQGRGTELVTLYIPPNRPLHEAAAQLRDEYGTATNIKSDTTRNHVQDALVRAGQRLKLYKTTPETGLALFSGALPTNGPGSEVVKVFEIIPPKPVPIYMYRCDDHFHLDPLKEMLREENRYGVLSIDSQEAGLAIIQGSRYDVAEVLTSGVSGKHRAGGQSARRFERLREMELNNFFHRVANHSAKVFLEGGAVKGLILSGPGHTKDDFLKTELLDYRLRDAILGVVDTSYAGEEGVREAVDKGRNFLENVRITEEKKLVQQFLREINAQQPKATYGLKQVIDSLNDASAEKVLVIEDLDKVLVKAICSECGKVVEKIVDSKQLYETRVSLEAQACSACSSTRSEVTEQDVIEYLADLARETAASVEVISAGIEEGAMLKSFGGVAALLRYAK
jgi:peptide chain release factor subunit 1